jgi:hypothetical protein
LVTGAACAAFGFAAGLCAATAGFGVEECTAGGFVTGLWGV